LDPALVHVRVIVQVCVLVLKLQAEFHHTHHFTLLHHKRQQSSRYYAYTYVHNNTH